jgi:hypothetical protein
MRQRIMAQIPLNDRASAVGLLSANLQLSADPSRQDANHGRGLLRHSRS